MAPSFAGPGGTACQAPHQQLSPRGPKPQAEVAGDNKDPQEEGEACSLQLLGTENREDFYWETYLCCQV